MFFLLNHLIVEQVVRQLGEGTFGKVVLVNDMMAEDAPRALKIITLSSLPELREKQVMYVCVRANVFSLKLFSFSTR